MIRQKYIQALTLHMSPHTIKHIEETYICTAQLDMVHVDIYIERDYYGLLGINMEYGIQQAVQVWLPVLRQTFW